MNCRRVFSLMVFLFMVCCNPGIQASDAPLSLSKGIQQYQLENYEEAIDLLIQARQEAPDSSLAAFTLGMAYKDAMQYDNALPHLKAAANLPPHIQEAVLEIVDIALSKGDLDLAQHWLTIAENDKILPARTAFATGRVFREQGRHLDAIESFKAAARLDSSLALSADFYIALSLAALEDFSGAADRLDTVIRADPDSDMADAARNYQQRLKEQIKAHRWFSGSLAVLGQYDTNIVLKPTDDAAAIGITGEKSTALTTSLRANFHPKVPAPWRFNAGWRIFSRLHRNHSNSHDLLSNRLWLSPSYLFGDWSLNLTAVYDHVQLRDPSYKAYLDEFSLTPSLRWRQGQNALWEIGAGYRFSGYVQPPLMSDEDRDGEVIHAALAGYFQVPGNVVLAVNYGFANDNADGQNHDNAGHRLSLTSAWKASQRLSFQAGAEALFENYRNTHTVYDVKRNDQTWQFSVGASWQLTNAAALTGRFAHTRADSNLSIYDYRRSVYSIGLEYRF